MREERPSFFTATAREFVCRKKKRKCYFAPWWTGGNGLNGRQVAYRTHVKADQWFSFLSFMLPLNCIMCVTLWAPARRESRAKTHFSPPPQFYWKISPKRNVSSYTRSSSASFRKLMMRNRSLRTTFHWVNDGKKKIGTLINIWRIF